jgi:hypothetical protein
MTGILSPAVPAGVPGEGPPQMPLAGDQHQISHLDPGGERSATPPPSSFPATTLHGR